MARPSQHKTNLYDVFIRAIDKGQLPLFGMFVLLVVIAALIPKDTLSEIILTTFKNLPAYLGYIGSVLISLVWYRSSKNMRRQHAQELERIGKEKTFLQNLIAGQKHPSSKS